MKEIQTTNLLYTDDENQRLLMSEEFNFALDIYQLDKSLEAILNLIQSTFHISL